MLCGEQFLELMNAPLEWLKQVFQRTRREDTRRTGSSKEKKRIAILDNQMHDGEWFLGAPAQKWYSIAPTRTE